VKIKVSYPEGIGQLDVSGKASIESLIGKIKEKGYQVTEISEEQAATDKPISSAANNGQQLHVAIIVCAARIMIFEGTQPILTQVPPMIGLRSMRVTVAPFSTAFSAQAKAPEPVPIIATCSCWPLFAAL
jgi:hypothetical protein